MDTPVVPKALSPASGLLTLQKQLLKQFSQAGQLASNLNSYLDYIAQELCRHFNYSICRIVEQDRHDQTLKLRVAIDLAQPNGKQAHFHPKFEEQIHYALSTNESLVIDHVAQESRIPVSRFYKIRGIESACLVPINQGTQRFGVLEVALNQEHRFIPDEVDFLESVASIMGILVQRFSLETTVQDLHKALLNTNSGYWLYNLSDRSFTIDDQQLQILGYNRADIPTYPEHLLKLIHPDEYDLLMSQGHHYLRSGVTRFQLECRLLNAGERYIAVICHCQILYGNDGHPTGLKGAIQDISEQKHYEQRIQECENRFQVIGDASPVMVWVTNSSAVATYMSKNFMDYHGMETQDLEWAKFVHPDDYEASLKRFLSAVDNHQKVDLEFRLKRHDGVYRWFYCQGNPQYEQDGAFLGYVGCFLDIDDIKCAEMARLQTESRFRKVVESNIIGLVFWSSTGEILEANQAFLDIIGYHSFPMVNQPPDWKSLTPAEFIAKDEIAIQEALKYGISAPYEKQLLHRDGHRIDILMRLACFEDSRETGIAFILDISNYNRALHAAQESSRIKSEFLASMSHELRTPLNAIIGFSQMLGNGMAGPITEKQAGYIKNVQQSGNHLLGIVNDLLDVSRLETGQLRLHPELINVPALLEEIHHMVQPFADQKQVSLWFSVQPQCERIEADPIRLKQIFLNLINNAIKFNRAQGYVRVSVSQSEDRQWIIGQVMDNGIGIPEEKQAATFQRFYQADAQLSRQYEGIGLGLAICKELVERHGGEITLHSQPDLGSTFTFKLPITIKPSS